MSPTEQQLQDHHGVHAVRLVDICTQYLAISPAEAKRRASLGTLPFPTFRLTASCKSPALVLLADLADLLDSAYDKARQQWVQGQIEVS